MDYKELKDFIKSVAKSGVTEVDIKTEKLKISIKVPPKGKAAVTHTETVIREVPIHTAISQAPYIQQPIQATVQNTTPQLEESTSDKEEDNNYIEIKSPMVGTFYRKPSPDKEPYVNVGDNITASSVVCIIEAMKLFNEIEAEVTGKIVKILVDDATPVEFDQPLFLVDPS